MEFVFEGDTSAIGNPEEIAKIEFGDNTFVYHDFICKSKLHKGFLELVVDGDYQLFLYRGIKYTYHEGPGQGVDGNTVTKYYADKRYYISINEATPYQLPEKKKHIISIFDIPEREIKDYLKRSGNKLKKNSEVVDLFIYLNDK